MRNELFDVEWAMISIFTYLIIILLMAHGYQSTIDFCDPGDPFIEILYVSFFRIFFLYIYFFFIVKNIASGIIAAKRDKQKVLYFFFIAFLIISIFPVYLLNKISVNIDFVCTDVISDDISGFICSIFYKLLIFLENPQPWFLLAFTAGSLNTVFYIMTREQDPARRANRLHYETIWRNISNKKLKEIKL